MRCSVLALRARGGLIESLSSAAKASSARCIAISFSSRHILHLSNSLILSKVPFLRHKRRSLTVMASTTSPREGVAVCFPKVSRGLSTLLDAPTGEVAPIKIECVTKSAFDEWLSSQQKLYQDWMKAVNFKGSSGEVCLIPASNGTIERAILGVEDSSDAWSYASLPTKLPPGVYSLEGVCEKDVTTATLGWILGTYSFDRYKSEKKEGKEGPAACMIWPSSVDRKVVKAISEGIFLARDMITTPAEDMTPQDIATEAIELAKSHGCSVSVVKGDELLKYNFPAIHTVGRASTNPPHLVDFCWSPAGSNAESLPKVTLVGKGVSFDTGGLDLKPANAMKLMKKDMGGAALMLGLAHAVMVADLPIALRVLIPTVENSVSGNAYRPLDVLQTRAGITVENGNTDAEGRLILCDALAEAASAKPDLLIDAATLTGAARVALGTELPALFCNNDDLASNILSAASESGDMLWRMPLHKPYRKMLDSKVADIASCSEGGYAGAITAALFLQEFVKGANAWAHIDTMGYNLTSKPGRPEGGEAFGLRALFAYLLHTYHK